MRRIKILLVLSVVCVLFTGVYAEAKKLSDEAELSFVDTGGNTDVTTLSAKNTLKYKFAEELEGTWKSGIMYGESSGERNAESYFTEFRLDYLITERYYANAFAGWLQNRFAGISNRFQMGPGIGYKFFNGPKHFLIGEAGLMFVYEEYTNNIDESYIGGRTFAQYQYAFTQKNKFSQSLELLFSFDEGSNYNVNSETALISALNNYLFLKASYEVKFDNQPVPATLDKTDTILAISLLVNF
ncbi:MAG: DUF481 domain-containing protein [Thermodesulfobacteriota bacterium]|nr:DUF481 domain-containing protein [Thermodesulfobacteriota bacterium]